MRRAVVQAGASLELIYNANNGQEAWDFVSENPVDLILLDLHMPVMDGETFARKLLADPSKSSIKIIIVSTESNQDRLSELMELGVGGYLHKPFKPEQLVELASEFFKEAA